MRRARNFGKFQFATRERLSGHEKVALTRFATVAGKSLSNSGMYTAGNWSSILVKFPPSAQARHSAEELLNRIDSERVAPSAVRRQQLRAIESLEHMNTPEARELLAELAKGQLGAWRTRETTVALSRFGKP
jgi:hypothetical protein